MRALVVAVGPERYTLSLDEVREVVAAPAVCEVPIAPEGLLGVMNLRGDVIPVLDTGRLLGRAPLGSAPYAAVVQTPRGLAALAADGEPQTATLAEPLRSEDGRVRHAVDGGLAAPIDLAALIGALRPAVV